MAGAESFEEEAQTVAGVQKCVSGFTELAAVRCAIELGIPDIIEKHPSGITLVELSSVLGCSPSSLHRVMRFLAHCGMFKEVKMDAQDSSIAYAPTPFSRLLMKNKMAPVLLLTSDPAMMAPKWSLSKYLLSKNWDGGAFQVTHGMDFWQYTAENPSLNGLFKKAMACLAGVVISAVIENSTSVFEGIGCLVDVGGSDGTGLRALVKACPWIIRAVNFDLPHVVCSCDSDDHVEHVGGDMFVSVPSADATLLMSVLHDWDDDACVKILKNCKESIPKETGKVIIVDIVIDDDSPNEGNNKYRDIHLASDIVMMAQSTKGKERDVEEWTDLLTAAGFNRYTIKHLPAPQSVIEAYP